jgi:hypothetical protein
MKKKELDSWFNSLDTFELGLMFPGEYEETLESADPGVNINTFVREVKAMWKNLSLEEKMELYEQFK